MEKYLGNNELPLVKEYIDKQLEEAKTDIKKNTLGNLSFAVNAQDKGLDITYTY